MALWACAPTATALAVGNQTVPNFVAAKQLAQQIWQAHPVTLYSSCAYRPDTARLEPGCSFVARDPGGRGGRIEWEHVVPAAAFGRSFAAWQRGDPGCVDGRGKAFRGRRCAQARSPAFRRVEADLYNLVPEIGEVNGLRGNLPMAQLGALAGVEAAAGRAQGSILLLPGLPGARRSGSGFEPPPAVRGDVARISLYMDAAYPELELLSAGQRQMMHAWSQQDPTDPWECRRAEAVRAVQGNLNSFIAATCPPQANFPIDKAAALRL